MSSSEQRFSNVSDTPHTKIGQVVGLLQLQFGVKMVLNKEKKNKSQFGGQYVTLITGRRTGQKGQEY